MRFYSEAELKARKLWLPRMQEAGRQCDSCPFLKDNEKQFGEVVSALKKSGGFRDHEGATIDEARERAWETAVRHGEFACHVTAYGPGMDVRPRAEHRQCPGATRAYRRGRP